MVVDQAEYGASVGNMPQRHEHSDQRQGENYEAEQCGFSTGRLHVFSLFVIRFAISGARGTPNTKRRMHYAARFFDD